MRKLYLNNKDLLLLKQIPKSNSESNIYILGNDLLKIYNNSKSEKEKVKNRIDMVDNLNIKNIKNILWLDSEIYLNDIFSGYSMKYLKDFDVISKLNINHKHKLKIFKDLSMTLKTLHENEIFIGDLNTQNIMFKGSNSFFIDTDSINYKNNKSNSMSKILYDFEFFNLSDKTDNFSLAYILMIISTDYDVFSRTREDLKFKMKKLNLPSNLAFMNDILINQDNLYLHDYIDNFNNFDYNKKEKVFEKKQ